MLTRNHRSRTRRLRRTHSVIVATLMAVLIVIAVGQGAGASAHAPGTNPIPTVFGGGPEVHLSPSFGPVGTKVTAVGLGFRPGTTVALRFTVPNSDFFSKPFAHALVGKRGRFQKTFAITAAMRATSPAYRANPSQFTQFGIIIQASSKNQGAWTAFIVTFG